jgi:hypothetical protein
VVNMQQQTQNRFYVYEHLRSDTGAIFYVGKGTGKRCSVKSHHHRNEFWQRTEKKAGGFCVHIVARDVDEELAFLIEQERISQLRIVGVRLCNMTDGGDGTSGWVKTPEWRHKVGAKHKGKVVSKETRAKISASVKASGYVPSLETRQKIADVNKGHQRTLGLKHSEETKLKMSHAHKGNKSRLGQVKSTNEKAKQSASMQGKSQAIFTCPHCQKTGGNAMKRWHFDNCKENQ